MKKLNIHYLQHVPYEDPGCILNWIRERGHCVTYTKFYEDEALPELSNIDWLIVMGGPMGVYDDRQFHWLKKERSYINDAINQNKTVLGICLGSQLIAAAMGAKVYPNQLKEIGWFNISITEQGKSNWLFDGFDSTFKVFHWHGDTFDLPDNAIHLASSKACKNQAFIINNKVLGLQFHFEVTAESLKNMVENGKDELQPAAYIQTDKQILDQTEHIAANNLKMISVLDALEKL